MVGVGRRGSFDRGGDAQERAPGVREFETVVAAVDVLRLVFVDEGAVYDGGHEP